MAFNFLHFNPEHGIHSEINVNMRLPSIISLFLEITYVLVHFMQEAVAKAGLHMQKIYWRRDYDQYPKAARGGRENHQIYISLSPLKEEGREGAV